MSNQEAKTFVIEKMVNPGIPLVIASATMADLSIKAGKMMAVCQREWLAGCNLELTGNELGMAFLFGVTLKLIINFAGSYISSQKAEKRQSAYIQSQIKPISGLEPSHSIGPSVDIAQDKDIPNSIVQYTKDIFKAVWSTSIIALPYLLMHLNKLLKGGNLSIENIDLVDWVAVIGVAGPVFLNMLKPSWRRFWGETGD